MPDTGIDQRLIEYIVIGAYLVVLLAIGFVFRRFNSNVSDYFRNGCKGTWWLVGSSAFMTAFSAFTFTASAGAAFEAGWSVMVIFIGNALGFLLTAIFFAPWFRQLRAITAPEVIRMRFGGTTQQFYAWMSMGVNLLQAGLWLNGAAIFAAVVFGFDLQTVIIVLGLVVLIYSVSGGSWAVMATDFLQSLILMPLTIALAVLCVLHFGGIGGFFENIHSRGLAEDFAFVNEPGRYATATDYTLAFAIATLVYKSIGYITMTEAQKYFGVKDGWSARKAAMLGCVLMLIGMCVWFIPPMTARMLFADEVMANTALPKPAESAYAISAMRLLPGGMTGLMVVAMFAATMSSMDSGLNRNAGIFIRDAYPALCRITGVTPMQDERKLFILGQVFSMIFGLIIIGLSLYFATSKDKGIFAWMLDIGALLAMPMAIPMLMAMFIRRAPWWSAMFSVVVTLIPSVIAFFDVGGVWSYQWKIAVGCSVGVGSFLMTMPFWKHASAEYRDQVDHFFTTMHTPIDFEKEVGQANDSSQLKIIGGFAVIVGVFICTLAALPNPQSGRLCILAVGGFVAVIGGLMAWQGTRNPDGVFTEDEEKALPNKVPVGK